MGEGVSNNMERAHSSQAQQGEHRSSGEQNLQGAEWIAARSAELQPHSIELLLQQGRYAQATMQLERDLMAGEQIADHHLTRLPQQYRRQSPYIMQALANSLLHAEEFAEAQQYAQLAVKGFAALNMPQHLLMSLALLGRIQLKLGEYEAAEVIVKQLRQEYEREQELDQTIVAAIEDCLVLGNTLLRRSDNIEEQEQVKSWHLYLFSGLRFSKGQEERVRIEWKRKKAKELLLYLALQPRYTAVREQVMDVLQLGEPIDKAAQQLYVIIHQLKRTLQLELGIEQAVVVREGLIRLREDMIEYVDVEHYLTLIRVADQLWQFDRSLSYEMYEQAYLLYDELLPELPYLEWLEQLREHILQKQALLLQKCISHAEERQDWQHAEIYLRSWIALKPFQEEAHAKLVSMFMQLGRLNEAKTAYTNWEQCCREELGTSPSFAPSFSRHTLEHRVALEDVSGWE